MASEYTPLYKKFKRAIGLGPKDTNLPLSGAVPAAQQRAAKEQSEGFIDKLKQVGERAQRLRDTQSSAYDFRSRNNLKRGQQ
jgi:hypothetical protein